jgi:hypothetical protein
MEKATLITQEQNGWNRTLVLIGLNWPAGLLLGVDVGDI